MTTLRQTRAKKLPAQLGVLLGAAALALLAACSTPDTRIKKNRALFDALAPTEQALIREGKVGIGFTPDMVLLAVGQPDQRWVRTTAEGQTEAWSYTRYSNYDGVPLYTGFYHRYYGARYHPFYYGAYTTASRPEEYFRVEFRDGRVTQVEQEQR